MWDVWISDGNEDVESAHIVIQLRFAADSVKECLEIVGDREQRKSKRKWHAEWLEEIMPGLRLRWWARDATLEERDRAEAEIAHRLDAFRAFLKDPKNEEAIQQAIDRINREAGLPPDSGNADKAADTEANAKDGK